MKKELVIVLDFGGQYNQLVARRVRECNVYCEIYSYKTDLETITTIVTRYYEQDTWKENLVVEKESFELLQDILEDAGELEERVPYEALVNTEYAETAAK